MRIAFFLNQFPVLSETFILDQMTGLIDRGHELDIYARGPGAGTPSHAEVDQYGLLARTRYHGMPVNRGRRVAAACRLLATRFRHRPRVALRALNPARYGLEAASLARLFWHAALVDQPPYDVVHGHFGPNGRLACQLREAGVLRGAVATTFYGYDLTQVPHQRGRAHYRDLFENSDLLLPISGFFRNKLLELGCPPEKIAVHHLGIDCSKFHYQARRHDPTAPIRLLSLARLVEKKGLEYAIRAVAKVAHEFPRIRYRIVGDGPLRRKLEQLIAQLAVGTQIELAGWRSRAEILAELARADLVLAPSVTAADGDQEGTPVALMEAMATGLPVLSTWHSGIPELVEDGVSGALVPERDADALAAKLRELLCNPSRWPEMGRRGRATVEQHFHIGRLNDQLVELYRGISLARTAPARRT
ncbi:MAG: hypothetical protein A2W31_00070 [Planctomycetes bacterium RBG_16_64_10]|nr:MAG: hypothetical protein A2W31_00070 [Planctomycetes bacterium RBG_16_64_10]